MGYSRLTGAVEGLARQACRETFWSCVRVLPHTRYLVNRRLYCHALRQTELMFCTVALGDCRERDVNVLQAKVCQGEPLAYRDEEGAGSGSGSVVVRKTWPPVVSVMVAMVTCVVAAVVV